LAGLALLVTYIVIKSRKMKDTHFVSLKGVHIGLLMGAITSYQNPVVACLNGFFLGLMMSSGASKGFVSLWQEKEQS